MCIIFFAYKTDPARPLIVAANRDEFYHRPTASAARWSDHPSIHAGRDLVHGGAWLGITDSGRFAAVTNFRDPAAPNGPRSRGDLVRDFLTSDVGPMQYLADIESVASDFSGFNLIVGDTSELCYFSNRGDVPRRLDAGIYGLSNHLLDTPWPKVRNGRKAFGDALAGGEISADNLFAVLGDKTLAPDDELPETGIGYEREKLLSAIFIETPVYGTRSSAVVIADSQWRLSLEERTFV